MIYSKTEDDQSLLSQAASSSSNGTQALVALPQVDTSSNHVNAPLTPKSDDLESQLRSAHDFELDIPVLSNKREYKFPTILTCTVSQTVPRRLEHAPERGTAPKRPTLSVDDYKRRRGLI